MAGASGISVVCFSNAAPAMLAASIARVRELAAEIVVAVDDRLDPDTLGPLRDVADRVIRQAYLTPFEANLEWLDSLPTSDWVLQLDGDDVVSDALVERLATPGWDDGITHAYVHYRWLWGRAGRMLDQAPWWPDPVLRLFRTDAVRRYPSTTHSGRQVLGPHRFLDEAIYHLDLVLNPVDVRAAKVDAYEAQDPGHRTAQGWAVSPTFYLPERFDAPPRTVEVPAADAAAIRTVLGAGGVEVGDGRSGSSDGAPGPPPAVGAGGLGLRLVGHAPVRLVAGRPAVLTVGVTNRSGRTWRADDDAPHLLGAVLRDRQGQPFGHELRTPFPGPVPTDDEVLVRLELPPTLPLGASTVDVGVLQEGIAWHGTRLPVPVEVQPGRQVLIRSGAGADGRSQLSTALASVARRLPDVEPIVLGPYEPVPDWARGLPIVDPTKASPLDWAWVSGSLPPEPPLS